MAKAAFSESGTTAVSPEAGDKRATVDLHDHSSGRLAPPVEILAGSRLPAALHCDVTLEIDPVRPIAKGRSGLKCSAQAHEGQPRDRPTPDANA
jgi:hypothetical protein